MSCKSLRNKWVNNKEPKQTRWAFTTAIPKSQGLYNAGDAEKGNDTYEGLLHLSLHFQLELLQLKCSDELEAFKALAPGNTTFWYVVPSRLQYKNISG